MHWFLMIVACVACIYLIVKVTAFRTYDLSDWTGNLWKWADKNSISYKKIPRHNKEYLLKIEELDIGNLNIEALPVELFNLVNLKKLYVSDNNISTIPEEIISLNLDTFIADNNPNLLFSDAQKEWIKKIRIFSFENQNENLDNA